MPNPYQPSVFLFVPCREITPAGGCTTGCSTGTRTSCATGCPAVNRGSCEAACATDGQAALLHGPRCKDGTCSGGNGAPSLFNRVLSACGLGGHRECHGDGSHRISDIDGKHCHLVRDCSGAQEVAGTQLVPGFRFAAAEQIRLYGGAANLPTTHPHWPVPAGEADKPAEAPKSDKPAEPAPEPKKKTGGTTGLSVNRPFTKP
jgi:hypothetical protein